jgi:predicted ATP-grasp superfamily ATP-dependent carboligase
MSVKTVLITNAERDATLAAARSFAARGLRVIAASHRNLPFGLRSRYSAASYVIAHSNQAELEAGLLHLLERTRPDFFLPFSSPANLAACKHRERFEAITKINVPCLEGFLAAYNEGVCGAECEQLGIPCPARYSLEQAEDLLKRDRETVLVVKPDHDVGAANGVRYVRNRQTLALALKDCVARFKGALIQEYIPGPVEAMKTVILVFSRSSQLLAAFTSQKRLQVPATGGLTAIGTSTADERLVNLVLPFFQKWKWRGPAEVELKTDARTGEHKVIEINPRFPGCLRFALECGLDLPALAIGLTADGAAIPLPFPSYRVGVEYHNPPLVLRSFLASRRSETRMNGESLAGVREVVKAVPSAFQNLRDPLSTLGRALAKFQR